MGSMTVNPASLALSGGSITKTDTGGSTSSIIIAATSAQSSLNVEGLAVIFENYSSTVSCTVTPLVGETFSEIGQGNADAITLSTAASIVVGGRDFETARFLDDDGYLNFSITTAATCYVYAVMKPYTQLNP